MFKSIKKIFSSKSVSEDQFNDYQFQMEALAFALMHYDRSGGDYEAVRTAISEIDLNDSQKDRLIVSLRAFKNNEAAREEAEKVIANADALLNQGRAEEAFEQCQQALAQSRGNAQLQLLSVNLLVILKRYDEAYERALNAFRADPNNIEWVQVLFQVVDQYKTVEETSALAENLKLEVPGQDYNIDYRKGLYLRGKKRYDEARDVFHSLNTQMEFAWNYYQLALINNETGNSQGCLEYLERTFELDPNLKRDALNLPELAALQGDRKFIQLTT